jgi:bifunctional DNA-binding transcriptional regulator/antitoxin component of YhaV-PrlF toxin-antitoxin module
MATIEKIQRITSKGQITLPIAWRRRMGTSSIVVRAKGETLEISPLRTLDDEDAQWVTIFDAVRDNEGKGIPVSKLIATLEKIDGVKKKPHGRTR